MSQARPLDASKDNSASEAHNSDGESTAGLRRRLIKLVFRQYGRNATLDNELARLHRALRDGSSRHDIDLITCRILDEMLILAAAEKPQHPIGASLATAGLKIRWPSLRIADQCDQLRRIGDDAAAIQMFADLVNRELNRQEEVNPESIVILERLLSRAALRSEPAAAANLENLRHRLKAISDEHELLAVAEDISELLTQFNQRSDSNDGTVIELISPNASTLADLLEMLPMSREDDEQFVELRNRLNTKPSEPPRRLTGAVTKFLTAIHNKARNELSECAGFLSATQLRLQTLHSLLLSSSRIRNEAMKDSKRLESMMNQHLAGIRSSIQSNDDIDTLKELVNQQLDGIDNDVSAFLEAEQTRAQAAEKAVTDLKTQLDELASQTVSLQDALAEEQTRATSDALTGIPNRLAYEERLSQMFKHWQDSSEPLSTIVIDIDLFKSINDRYGHHAGDRVLAKVAEQIGAHIRASDFLGRFGGEEFVVLLPNTAQQDAGKLAEKLRAEIDECRFRYGDSPVSVTISCGISEFREGDERDSPFQRADEALYLAKQSGRNCCRVAADAVTD